MSGDNFIDALAILVDEARKSKVTTTEITTSLAAALVCLAARVSNPEQGFSALILAMQRRFPAELADVQKMRRSLS